MSDLKERIAAWLGSPPVLRVFFAVGRPLFPVVKLKGSWMVLRHEDVVDVLRRDADFGVAPNYAERMAATTGPFFLGMEDTPLASRERAFAYAAVGTRDARRVRAIVHRAARKALDEIPAGMEFDFVERFSRRLPCVLVQSYFGVPGPDDATLAFWMRAIFRELFVNFVAPDPRVTEAARKAAAEMSLYLDDLIAKRRFAPARGRRVTFLDRLVANEAAFPGLAPDAVRRTIGGVIVGAFETLAKAMVFAVREIERRPDVVARLREAACVPSPRDRSDTKAVSGAAAARDRVRRIVLEALRFDPHNPLIVRHATRDVVIAPGTRRETRIEAGDRVFAWTLSANFDSAGFERPSEFTELRPEGNYLHFGSRLHRCFGERFVEIVLPTAIGELYRRGGARPLGPVELEGTFPDRWPARLAS